MLKTRRISKSACQKLLSAALVLSLAQWGCASLGGDAPRSLLSTGQANGVNVKSGSPPYRVVSLSRLNRVDNGHQNWTLKEVQRTESQVDAACAYNWCWSVLGVQSVSASMSAFIQHENSIKCPMPHDTRLCQPLDWAHAFVRLHDLAAYLDDRKPAAFRVTLHFLPEGDGLNANVNAPESQEIHLEFGRWWPSSSTESSGQASKVDALVDAVSTTMYEYQHVVFTTQHPQKMSRAIKAVQDEAISTCWDLSARLALYAGYDKKVKFPYLDNAIYQSYQDAFGTEPEFGKASLQGPVLAWRELTKFTQGRPGADVIADKVNLAADNIELVNDVVSFCKQLSNTDDSIASPDFKLIGPTGTPFLPTTSSSSQ